MRSETGNSVGAFRSALLARWALVLGATLGALLAPPLLAFSPQPLAALACVAVGAALLLWPTRSLRLLRVGWRRAVGATILWATLLWCTFSQIAPVTQPISLVWSLRGLPVACLAGIWLLAQLPHAWQRRALLAATAPTVAALLLVAWSSPPHSLNFEPYYIAVDAHGTVYVTDTHSPVIRVFAPDGTLRAKLRPGLATRQGIPGPGFSPPGRYNDPDGLGVPRATPGASSVSGALLPWAPGTDDFWFCGLALDSANRLFVPDWMHNRLLRFTPAGTLDGRWPLPDGYEPSLGCVTAAGSHLYLSDAHGAVLQYDLDGRLLTRWRLPEPIVGGLSATPDGAALLALGQTHVYRFDLQHATGQATTWTLPTPTGALQRPYQAILALGGDRTAISNLATHRVDLYCGGQPCGHIGVPGQQPGQFGQVGNLARDHNGELYVADFDHRVLQRFAPSGRLDALYWSPDDDEID